MNMNKHIGKAISSVILAGSIISSNASAAQIIDWQLDTSSIGGTLQTNIFQLGFGGASFIDTSANVGDPTGTAFTFTDTGVFNVTTFNNATLLGLVGSGNELTAAFSSNGSGVLGGAFSFASGGTLDLYFDDNRQDYGAATNNYGTTNGVKIASFDQLAGGGGFVNPDGTPVANGNITLIYQATFLNPAVWKNVSGTALLPTLTLGFVTSNAANLAEPIDANLIAAIGSGNPTSVAPDYFYVSNGGQFKLNTVPEPDTLALLGIGLLGAGFRRRITA